MGRVYVSEPERDGVVRLYLLLYHPDNPEREPVAVGLYLSQGAAEEARPSVWPDYAWHPSDFGSVIAFRYGVDHGPDGDWLPDLDPEVRGQDGERAGYVVCELDVKTDGETDPVRLAALAALGGDGPTIDAFADVVARGA